jgi:hypothetical protein
MTARTPRLLANGGLDLAAMAVTAPYDSRSPVRMR